MMLSRVMEARQSLAELGYLVDSKIKFDETDIHEIRQLTARLKSLNLELESRIRAYDAQQNAMRRQLIEVGDKIHEITIRETQTSELKGEWREPVDPDVYTDAYTEATRHR